jgi:hypothetical protein
VKAIAVPVAYDYYYSVQDYYRDQLLADAIAYRILSRGSNAQPAAPVSSQPEVQAPAPNTPDVPPPKAMAAGDWKQKLSATITSKCVKCHGGGSVQGGLNLTNIDAVPELQRATAFALVETGVMPKDGRPVDNEEVTPFFQWLMEAKAARKK